MINQTEALSESQKTQLSLLRSQLKGLQKVCVAYSGGVDSSLVATLAHEQLGSGALAITGVSSSLAPHLRIEAQSQARWIGIRHKECFTHEIGDPAYSSNPENRCFACKKELHYQLKEILKESRGFQVIDGVNDDDLHDHRPGIQAAKEAGVRSPLAEIGISKINVRAISKALGLPWWDKPAQPCLASRFPYGESINHVKLRRVDKAEAWLRKQGFTEVRVRSKALSAKIEVCSEEINKLILQLDRQDLIDYFISIGFSSVSIDLEGFISGKLNRNLEQ